MQIFCVLFGVKQPAISMHLSNIFREGELDKDSVHSILEYSAADGKTYGTKFYNLDAILSVGYRVNSRNATLFWKWANSVLKDYILRGYAYNQQLLYLEERIDCRLHDVRAKDFLGIWERINNPDFNVTEFSNIRMEAGTNGFVLSRLKT